MNELTNAKKWLSPDYESRTDLNSLVATFGEEGSKRHFKSKTNFPENSKIRKIQFSQGFFQSNNLICLVTRLEQMGTSRLHTIIKSIMMIPLDTKRHVI